MSRGSSCGQNHATHLIFNLVQLYPRKRKARRFLEASGPPRVRQHDHRLSACNNPTISPSFLSCFSYARISYLVHKQSVSLSLSVAESSRTLKSLSGGHSDRARGQGVEAEMNTKGPGKKNAAVEANKGKRALASEVGLEIVQVKPLVLIRVLTEKYRGAGGEGFVCLG